MSRRRHTAKHICNLYIIVNYIMKYKSIDCNDRFIMHILDQNELKSYEGRATKTDTGTNARVT
jgi:hypothetical protein